MNTIKCLAILAALLLTSAEALIFDYDTRERAAQYQADACGRWRMGSLPRPSPGCQWGAQNEPSRAATDPVPVWSAREAASLPGITVPPQPAGRHQRCSVKMSKRGRCLSRNGGALGVVRTAGSGRVQVNSSMTNRPHLPAHQQLSRLVGHHEDLAWTTGKAALGQHDG